jgi:hypothetical protein
MMIGMIIVMSMTGCTKPCSQICWGTVSMTPDDKKVLLSECKRPLFLCWDPSGHGPCQGCQIFLGATHQNGKIYQILSHKIYQWPQNIPNGHKIYQMATKYTKWSQNIPSGHKIYQMVTKYTKWPQNIPNRHKIYQMTTKYTKWPQNIPNGHM